jgi:hypothetical protein
MLLLLLPQRHIPKGSLGAYVNQLQLAMNCSYPATVPCFTPSAWAAEELLPFPAQLDAPAARRLSLTSAVRHNAEVARRLARVPALQQHLDAATLTALLKVLLPRATDDELRQHAWSIYWLLEDQQAVMQHMGYDDVVEVLHVAVATRTVWVAWALFKFWFEVAQLGLDDVLELMRAALPGNETDMDLCDELAALPVAQQLTIGDVVQRLQAAAEACDVRMVCTLLHLPAAQQLSDSDVMLVLRAADKSRDDSVWYVCHVLLC